VSRAARVAAGLLLGAALLAWLIATVDLRGAAAAARAATPGSVAGIGGLTLAFLLLKTWRWRVLLGEMPAPRRLLLRGVMLGSALNYVLPQAGEAARVAILHDGPRRPPAALLASIAAERVMDMLAVALLASIVATGPAGAVGGLPVAPVLLACSLAAVGIVALAIRAPAGFAEGLARGVAWAGAGAADSVRRHARDAIAGLQPLRSPRVVAAAFALSALQWACMAGAVALAMAGVGLAPEPSAAALTTVVLVAGLLLPSAPGYAGTTQAAFVVALAPLGNDPGSALAASLVYNVVVVGTVLVVALPFALPRGGGPGRQP
jgi:uncharacterized membrane protein YbhN (UPF0104 family)